METLELTNPTEPVMDISTATVVALCAMEQSQHLERWKLKLRECEVQCKAYKNFRAALYSIIMGQCTSTMEERISSHDNYKNVKTDQDGLGLLKIIKSNLFGMQENIFPAEVACKAAEKFYTKKEGENENNTRFFENFHDIVEQCDDCGVELAHPSVVASVADAAGRDPNNPKAWLDEDYVKAPSWWYVLGTFEQ